MKKYKEQVNKKENNMLEFWKMKQEKRNKEERQKQQENIYKKWEMHQEKKRRFEREEKQYKKENLQRKERSNPLEKKKFNRKGSNQNDWKFKMNHLNSHQLKRKQKQQRRSSESQEEEYYRRKYQPVEKRKQKKQGQTYYNNNQSKQYLKSKLKGGDKLQITSSFTDSSPSQLQSKNRPINLKGSIKNNLHFHQHSPKSLQDYLNFQLNTLKQLKQFIRNEKQQQSMQGKFGKNKDIKDYQRMLVKVQDNINKIMQTIVIQQTIKQKQSQNLLVNLNIERLKARQKKLQESRYLLQKKILESKDQYAYILQYYGDQNKKKRKHLKIDIQCYIFMIKELQEKEHAVSNQLNRFLLNL